MKTFLLLKILLLLAVCPVVSQVVYTSQRSGDWNVLSTWSPAVPPQSPADLTDVIIRVQAGDTVTITSSVVLEGDLVIEIFGTLKLLKSTSISGELNLLHPNSSIRIAAGGHLLAETAQGTGSVNSTWLTIGGNDAKLNGGRINELASPNVITRDTILGKGKGGCAETTGCVIIPLPVELLFFRASTTTQGIQLDWASAKEWDFSHYTLERSGNGKDYTPLHEQYTSGDSHSTKKYTYLDRHSQHGANYYRLKATDIDGTVEYKGVVLAYSGTVGGIEVSPNPSSTGLVRIFYPRATEGTWVEIVNSTGTMVLRIDMPEKELTVSTGSFPKGLYIVKVSNQLGVTQSRLIIQ